MKPRSSSSTRSGTRFTLILLYRKRMDEKVRNNKRSEAHLKIHLRPYSFYKRTKKGSNILIALNIDSSARVLSINKVKIRKHDVNCKMFSRKTRKNVRHLHSSHLGGATSRFTRAMFVTRYDRPPILMILQCANTRTNFPGRREIWVVRETDYESNSSPPPRFPSCAPFNEYTSPALPSSDPFVPFFFALVISRYQPVYADPPIAYACIRNKYSGCHHFVRCICIYAKSRVQRDGVFVRAASYRRRNRMHFCTIVAQFCVGEARRDIHASRAISAISYRC